MIFIIKLIEPKVLIEYFIELKDKINDKEFNYDLCKFLCQLFDRLDFSMCDSLANMNNTQNKEEKLINNLLKKGKTGISIVDVYLKIVGEIVEFFKEFEQDKILFEGFDKYTDDYYQKKRLTATPEEIDKINYDCIILTHYANSLSESKEKAAVQILSTVFDSINLNNSTAQVHNDIKISINCLDYMEKIIDYLILLRNANSKDYSKKDLDNKIYKLLNLYIRAKNINQKIIIPKSKDEEIVDFKEEIEKKLSKLQDVVVNVNKYLAEKQSDEEKQLIVKNFFKSAFDDYIKNGRQTNANSEYDIHDLSDRDIDLCYDAIKSNQSLINQIVTGEILVEPYVRARDMNINHDYATGDYTNLVVCQIKAMERYVKEVLVQHHKEEIWKTKPQQGGARWPDEWKKTDKIGNKIRVPQNPTAEDLHDLECGGAIYALRKAYEIEEHVRDNFCISYKFYTKGIHEVRNGHLHIDKIKTVDDALMRRSQTAFWIMYLITKLGDKGKLTR